MTDPTSAPSRPMFTPAVAPSERPLSPHMQIWRWTVTMAGSITQRATGIALYAGFGLLALWLAAAAIGEDTYNLMKGLLGSPIGLVILLGFTWAQMYHLCKGIVHLMWDGGHMISKESGRSVVRLAYIASIVLTAVIWIAAFALKG